MSLQNIYKIRTEMKKLHKKSEVLNKKQQSFGLTAEEEITLKQVKAEWFTLREELIESHLEVSAYPYLLSKESNEAISAMAWKISITRC